MTVCEDSGPFTLIKREAHLSNRGGPPKNDCRIKRGKLHSSTIVEMERLYPGNKGVIQVVKKQHSKEKNASGGRIRSKRAVEISP